VQSKLFEVEMSLRGILRGFGLKVGHTTPTRFAGRIGEPVATLKVVAAALLAVHETLRLELCGLENPLAEYQTQGQALRRERSSLALAASWGCGIRADGICPRDRNLAEIGMVRRRTRNTVLDLLGAARTDGQTPKASLHPKFLRDDNRIDVVFIPPFGFVRAERDDEGGIAGP
jgi:hypothetical protein